jgi:hypothetical protein
MQQTGASFEDTVELLYGVVGSNRDTRDWNAIMASSDPLAAARSATAQMYSNPASTNIPDRQVTTLDNPNNAPSIVRYTTTLDGPAKEVYGIVAADGTLLRGGFTTLEQAAGQGVNFGVGNIASTATLTPQQRTTYEQQAKQSSDPVVSSTANNKPALSSSSAAQLGYDPADIQRYLNSEANRAGGYGTTMDVVNGQTVFTPMSTEQFVQKMAEDGKNVLSKYLSPQELNQMTQKQLLAAHELYYQGGGVRQSNGLSVEDVDWIKNKANDFAGAVVSPSFQAISTGAGTSFSQAVQVPKSKTIETIAPRTADQARQTDAASVFRPETTQPTQPVQPQPQPPVTQQVTPPSYGTQPIRATPTPSVTTNPFVPVTGGVSGVYPMTTTTGTFTTPVSTGQLSAVPQTVTYRPSYTGTPGNVPETLYQAQQMQQQQAQGVRNVMYRNAAGATMYITEVNGQPMTAVPAGYTKVEGQAEGGMTNPQPQPSSPFTPQQKFQLLQRMGYRGPASEAQMQQFIEANPATAARFGKLSRAATKRMGMSQGGMVSGYQTGGFTEQLEPRLEAVQMTGSQQPTVAPVAMIQPEAAQYIPSDAGMAVPQAPFAEAATMQQAEQAMMPVMTPATLMQAATAAPAVTEAMAGVAPAAGEVSQQAQVQAAQQAETSVSQLQAAQGQAYMMNNPVQREIQSGELITGAADAAKAAQFVEQIQAAEATPTKQATVQGQLEGLMQQFEGGATPAWAAGAMRNAMATLSARGLGASSLAGQAVVQAAMESALPIAQIDAQTRASFESQNLSNRQQVAMFAAQQRAAFMQMEFDQAFQSRVQNAARIADVANMNFTAEQQVALENSRAANTMNLANLNNRQAMVMAEAAALSNLDMANLNNRQQAAVQNAQNFLQMDMANLGNEQQTALFRAQQVAQALFTDQAAENASRQFNATSENQTNQFFASLSSQVSQFNAAQRNAIDQYNIDQVNSIRRFNSEIQQQRDLFNAQNGLVIAQANAQWRQNLTTLNTAAQNEANRQFAQVLNNMSQTTLDQIWQRERDIMAFSFQQAENAAERAANVALAKLTAEEQAKLQDNIGQGKLMATVVDGIVNWAVGSWS